MRIRRRNEGRHGAGRVARIALGQVPRKGAQISSDSFFYQLLIPALGPYFGSPMVSEPRLGHAGVVSDTE